MPDNDPDTRRRSGSVSDRGRWPIVRLVGSRDSLGFAIEVDVDRYLDHLVLERHCAGSRHGSTLSAPVASKNWRTVHIASILEEGGMKICPESSFAVVLLGSPDSCSD